MVALRSFRRAFLMAVLLLIVCLPSLGQEPTSQEAIDPLLKQAIANAPTAEQWPDSDYAVLLDLETYAIGADGLPTRELRIVRKVFNKHAKEIGDMLQRYDNRDLTITILKARTIQRDGTIYEAGPPDIKTTKRKPDNPEKDWTDEIRVTMPAVESGCILDITWKIQVIRVQIPGHFEIDSWNFSDPEGPVSLSRLTLVAPSERQIHYRVYNDSALQPTVSTAPDGKTKTYVWERRDLPALQPKEPFMPDFDHIGVWMDVSTVSDYQTIADWFGKLFQASMTATDEVRKTAEKVAGSKRTAEEKARTLYEWMVKNIRYDIMETGKQDFGPDTATDVFKRKSGDCKDQSVLLATMLQVVGVPSFPVLVPREEHKRPSGQLPIVGNFDHCIVQAMVDGKPVWLDVTSEEDYGLIPLPLEGREAFVIRQGVGTFETFPDLEHSETIIREVTYQENGERREKVEHVLKNIARARSRRLLSSRDVQLFWNPNTDIWEKTQIDGTAKVKNENGELRFQIKVRVKNDVVREGDRLKASLPLDSNMEGISLPVMRRKWPLVMPNTHIETIQCVIKAPKGYVIENSPESTEASLYHVHYSRKMEKSPDGRAFTITITARIQANEVLPTEIDIEKTKAFLKALPPSKIDMVFVREGRTR